MGLHNQSAFKRVLMLTAGSTATPAEALLNAYGPNGFAMTFSGSEPSIKIVDNTTPSNNWDSKEGPANSVQNFFKTRSFTSYTGPVTTGKRLRQADGFIKPCRHNLIPMSNRFGSAAWTLTAATSTYGQTDVDGGATASLITESNTSTSVLYNATAFTTAANVPYTISCKIKKGNSTWVRLAFGTSGGTFTNGVQQWYNLDTVATGTAATTGTASYISSSITATTNSYYILTLTASQASTTGAFIVSTATADASATRTTSGTYYICHAMANAGQQALDYVSSEAHNLCLQSQTLDDASWTKSNVTVTANDAVAPDGTTTADLLTATGNAAIYNGIPSLPVSTTLTFSIWLKSATGSPFTIAYYVNGSGTDPNPQTGTLGTVTTSWQRFSVQVTTASSSATGNFALGDYGSGWTSGQNVHAWGAQVELASSPGKYVATTTTAVYNPHFDIPVEYNTDGTVKALTREEARTNLITYSNFESTGSTWSTQAGAVLTPGTVTGPDGIANSAATLALDTALVTSCFKGSSPITGAGTYTVSVYAKGSVGGEAFNIITYNGTDGEQDGPTETLTTDWVLYSATFTQTTTTNTYFGRAASGSASTIYVWGAQCEAGATASSRIRTGSSAVTRAADHIYWATTISPFSAAEVMFYAKQIILNTPTVTDTICALNANGSYGSGGGLLMRMTALDGHQVGGNSSSVSKTIVPTASVGGTVKFAGGAKVSTTTQACTNNGQAAATDATCDWNGTSNRVVIGNIQSGVHPGSQGLVEFMLLPSYDTTVMQTVTS